MYDICRYYVDFCTRTQFSSVRMQGLENIPSSGAVILAPNHCAALMDPLLILLTRHGSIGFGARSDIFSNPKVARFLNFLRILPMARERNGLREVAKNFETIGDIIECLRHEVPFCMYSEGMHRAEKGLLPIKKGIFKIARKAAEELEKPVYVVPIGVDYEYFFRIQGRVSMKVGKPIDVRAYFEEHKEDSEASTYASLCDRLHSDILDLLDNIPERCLPLCCFRCGCCSQPFPLRYGFLRSWYSAVSGTRPGPIRSTLPSASSSPCSGRSWRLRAT